MQPMTQNFANQWSLDTSDITSLSTDQYYDLFSYHPYRQCDLKTCTRIYELLEARYPAFEPKYADLLTISIPWRPEPMMTARYCTFHFFFLELLTDNDQTIRSIVGDNLVDQFQYVPKQIILGTEQFPLNYYPMLTEYYCTIDLSAFATEILKNTLQLIYHDNVTSTKHMFHLLDTLNYHIPDHIGPGYHSSSDGNISYFSLAPRSKGYEMHIAIGIHLTSNPEKQSIGFRHLLANSANQQYFAHIRKHQRSTDEQHPTLTIVILNTSDGGFG
jgi:hypothetical protein